MTITRIRPVEDTAQWVAGDTGQIVEAVKLSDLESVHIDDLADCAHELNGALEARDAAVKRAEEAEKTTDGRALAWIVAYTELLPEIRKLAFGEADSAGHAVVLAVRSLRERATSATARATEAEGQHASTLELLKAVRDCFGESQQELEKARSDRDALRVKLAEAQQERDGVSVRLARALDVIKAARLYRTGKAPLGLLFERLDAHDVTSNAIIDAVVSALTPSPASEGAEKPVPTRATAERHPCGECEHYDGRLCTTGTVMAMQPDNDMWCATFRRRLPLAPAKPADKHCGDCVYRNTAAAPGICVNVFSPNYQEARGTDDAKACDLHSAKWLCGRCLGGGFAKHTHNCSLRDKPEPQPARTCGDAKPDTCGECPSLSFRNTCESHTSTHSGHVRGTLDPACPAFVRSPAAAQEVKS